MQLLSKDKFIRQLNSLDFHEELHDFFDSQRFEELKKKWSDNPNEHLSWVFQDGGEKKNHSQKALKKAENLKVPDSTSLFLKHLKECMSDSKAYLWRAEMAAIDYSIGVKIDEQRLFPPALPSSVKRPQPNSAFIHSELKRKHVILDLLWREYK